MNQAGLVAIALAGLWIAYLVPHRLRFRQQLLESRTDDRFSDRLRVLRVARPAPASASGTGTTARVGGSTGGRVHLHPIRGAGAGAGRSGQAVQVLQAGRQTGRARPGGRTMDRPHATRDRIAVDAVRRTAAEHAQRAAYLARRGAAARRRAGLTAVLLLSVVAGWATVGIASAGMLVGVVPTALLLGVLGLGRQAVRAGARADAAWAAGAADRVPLPVRRDRATSGVVGRAVHPSDATTEVFARIPSADAAARSGSGAGASGSTERTTTVERTTGARRSATAVPSVPGGSVPGGSVDVATSASPVPEAAPERVADVGEAASTWAPVPVPRPAYTLKPAARRAEPAPLVLDQPARAAQDDAAGTSSEAAPTVADGAPTTGGLSLDAILARRRASGE